MGKNHNCPAIIILWVNEDQRGRTMIIDCAAPLKDQEHQERMPLYNHSSCAQYFTFSIFFSYYLNLPPQDTIPAIAKVYGFFCPQNTCLGLVETASAWRCGIACDYWLIDVEAPTKHTPYCTVMNSPEPETRFHDEGLTTNENYWSDPTSICRGNEWGCGYLQGNQLGKMHTYEVVESCKIHTTLRNGESMHTLFIMQMIDRAQKERQPRESLWSRVLL